MSGWSTHSGTATCLPLNNINTDQILPARFMSQPRSAGYGEFLLHDLRRDADGKLDSAFALNPHPDSSVLITGDNFGSGSSREAAVYALVDSGIQVVIANGFGDIFAANAVNNGLLPAVLEIEDLEHLTRLITDGITPVVVDLNTCSITANQQTFTFQLDPTWIDKLINGWDDIDLTLKHAHSISRYREQHRVHRKWAWPVDTRMFHKPEEEI